MDAVNRNIHLLLNSIQKSDVYRTYKKQEAILEKNPELVSRVQHFRSDNFRLQNEERGNLLQDAEHLISTQKGADMGDTKDRVGAAEVIVAGGFFKIALYVCVAVLVIWIGKVTYQFGYNVFNQQAMNPGEGQEVTVVIKEDATSYDIAKTLKSKGLIEDTLVFWVQEKLSNYSGKMKPGTYLLSTAYTPNRIMGILAGDAEQEGATS